MPPEPSAWRTANFIERLDEWITAEQPSEELRQHVTTWLLSRIETPYAGVKRQPGFPNLWYGVVPGSLHGDQVVVCSYWIDEQTHSVRCDSIGTLSWPA